MSRHEAPLSIAQSVKAITDYLGIDADKFTGYLDEDNIGGWDTHQPEPDQTTRYNNPLWICGSMWEIEGKLLYATIRAIKPLHILEVGSFHGCSTTHMCEALLKNGKGKLTSIDITHRFAIPTRFKGIIKQEQKDVFKYTFTKTKRVDFVFEDLLHTAEQVGYVWEQFKRTGKKGGVIVSHDSEHPIEGGKVREGIEQVTVDYLSFKPSPSDCGMAMWRKP